MSFATGSAAGSNRLADIAGNGTAAHLPAALAIEAAAPKSAAASPYTIGRHDVLAISVFKVPDLSRTLQVSEAGTINFPLIGERVAAGLTARELERDLARALGRKYLESPQVSVLVKQHNSQRVTIEGAVKKPGVYAMQGGMSLLQLVAQAQGFTDTADDILLVFRERGGKRVAARFDMNAIRQGDHPDPRLEAGDVVVANSSRARRLFNDVIKALPIAGVFALL